MQKRLWLGALVLAAALPCSETALAAKRNTSAHADKPAHTARHHRAKAPRSSGSGESTNERERRLTRECRGMPNAGACLGYAS